MTARELEAARAGLEADEDAGRGCAHQHFRNS
jgi:hypothetical protein